ncbi:multidrug effflux MFS transporter [Bdellovibrio sp. NC01]|uniref:multidrug effflux MFS transporter n=1 Tax=Bdellovibrio sp. NC01 TaxID=2220073 RepID=UPI00115B16A8|nr:multidrug effflux MFS transporter [Bdellovibrio sp. NC01]QDK36360.1 Bcr/CflA family drug resistance efflux transporter [Bdellovibrio sp. NC01]
MSSRKISNFSLILILGALTALCPFSIDMYLPAFPKMAEDFHSNVAQVSLSLSSFFIGLAIGQLFYGPLLDRFGRKRPLYFGLGIYLLATLACLSVHSIEALIVLRVIQALGGCVANVAAIAMVRDFFSPKDSAKVFSLLILILGVSPLLAPTAGGYLAASLGWQSIFAVLAAIGFAILLLVFFFLPEGHEPDKTQSLMPGPILKNYFEIFKNTQFHTFTLAGAVIFSGLFVYLAASPVIFMEIFKVSEKEYGWIFSFLAMGFIGSSQLNIFFLRLFHNEKILKSAMYAFAVISLVFFAGAWQGWLSLPTIIAIFFMLLAMVGLANPNASALAMAPFSRNAGSASALMGSLQMAVGSLASVCVGVFDAQQLLPISGIFIGASVVSLIILFWGNRRIDNKVIADPNDAPIVSH